MQNQHLWRHFGDKVLAKNMNNLRLKRRVSCGIVSYLNATVKMCGYVDLPQGGFRSINSWIFLPFPSLASKVKDR